MLQFGSAESDSGFLASVDLPAGIDIHFRPHPVVFRFIGKRANGCGRGDGVETYTACRLYGSPVTL